MTSLIVSTVVFFVASYFIKQRFEEMEIPKGLVRSATIFALALALSYGVAAAVDWVSAHA